MTTYDQLYHRHDPKPSRDAASLMVQTGALDKHAAIVLGLLRQHPDSTANELWAHAVRQELDGKLGDGLQEVRRRLSTMLKTGEVRQMPSRRCSILGKKITVWRAVATDH